MVIIMQYFTGKTYLVHIDGRKHVLKHGGHEFDLHAIRSKVIEDE